MHRASGVKYLRGAWLLSDGSYDTAVKWYASGYYYEAKRRGIDEVDMPLHQLSKRLLGLGFNILSQ